MVVLAEVAQRNLSISKIHLTIMNIVIKFETNG